MHVWIFINAATNKSRAIISIQSYYFRILAYMYTHPVCYGNKTKKVDDEMQYLQLSLDYVVCEKETKKVQGDKCDSSCFILPF